MTKNEDAQAERDRKDQLNAVDDTKSDTSNDDTVELLDTSNNDDPVEIEVDDSHEDDIRTVDGEEDFPPPSEYKASGYDQIKDSSSSEVPDRESDDPNVGGKE